MDDLVKVMVSQLPSVAGLVFAVLVMREQNQKLLDLLKDCYDGDTKVTEK